MTANYTTPGALLAFRTGAAAETAVTASGNGTALTDAKLAGIRGFMLLLSVQTLDLVSANETYAIKVQGRLDAADAYVDITADLSITAVGLAVLNVPRAYPDMRLVHTIGGTTPSMKFAAIGVVPEEALPYSPDGSIVTA